jgi:hypothetical protein
LASVDPIVWIKRALLLIVVGLVVQLLCVFSITPASFLLFVGGGFGPVAIGLLFFIYSVVLVRRANKMPEVDRDA